MTERNALRMLMVVFSAASLCLVAVPASAQAAVPNPAPDSAVVATSAVAAQTDTFGPDAKPDAANDAAAAAWYERNPEPSADDSAYRNGNYGWVLAPNSAGVASPAGTAGGGPVAGSAMWAACGLTNPASKVVKSYSRVAVTSGGQHMNAGTTNLLCGDAGSGYLHIVKNHLSQWESDAAVENINWRDLAHWEIGLALSAPAYVAYRSANNTMCFSHQIYLVNHVTGQIVMSKWPTIVISRSDGHIITAFPSTNTSCASS